MILYHLQILCKHDSLEFVWKNGTCALNFNYFSYKTRELDSEIFKVSTSTKRLYNFLCQMNTSELLLQIQKAFVLRQSKTGGLINSRTSFVFQLFHINLGSLLEECTSAMASITRWVGCYTHWSIFGFIV